MHVCEICGEEFNSGVELGGHKAGVHADESNCKHCGETFKKQLLKQHQKSCPKNPKNKTYCKNCDTLLTEQTQKKFCSNSCAASFNNKGRKHDSETRKKIAESVSESLEKLWDKGVYDDAHRKRDYDYKEYPDCLNCGTKLNRHTRKYCSNECQHEHFRENRFKIIEETGSAEFGEGFKEETKRKWLKRYHIEKHGEKCMECGWGEVNPHTGNVPIELDHINGDHQENTVENTRLLCPNCHSLTRNYKGANLGSGRTHRRKQK